MFQEPKLARDAAGMTAQAAIAAQTARRSSHTPLKPPTTLIRRRRGATIASGLAPLRIRWRAIMERPPGRNARPRATPRAEKTRRPLWSRLRREHRARRQNNRRADPAPETPRQAPRHARRQLHHGAATAAPCGPRRPPRRARAKRRKHRADRRRQVCANETQNDQDALSNWTGFSPSAANNKTERSNLAPPGRPVKIAMTPARHSAVAARTAAMARDLRAQRRRPNRPPVPRRRRTGLVRAYRGGLSRALGRIAAEGA